MRYTLLLLTLVTLPLFGECTTCKTRTGSWTGHRASNEKSILPSFICNGYTEVMAEALYLRPTMCDLDYVIVDPRPIPMPAPEIRAWLPQGTNRLLDPDHDWGFRVGLGTVYCCYDLRAIYTRQHSNQRFFTAPSNNCGLWVVYAHPETARFSPTYNPFFNGSPTEGIPAVATAAGVFDYDTFDLEVGSRGMLKCQLALRSSLGLHFAYIDTSFSDTWQGTEFDQFPPTLFTEQVSNRDHRRTWGIGPSIGLDAHYPLACGFGFEAHIGGAMLAGNRSHTRDGTLLSIRIPDAGPPLIEREQPLHVQQASHAALVPYLNARLGLDYVWSCQCCFTVQLAFGYEFHSYINAIEIFRFNDARATGQSQCDSYNLNGLYLRARFIL